jgi:hypothetical protein
MVLDEEIIQKKQNENTIHFSLFSSFNLAGEPGACQVARRFCGVDFLSISLVFCD